ncbi:MAG: bacteriophage transcriptional regulator [Herbinix sp.]|jgi:transcriptional regulator with XRE-family HTH domain|nr:bacteriophage transcriptional regulator [Herbinix sp.]
MDLYERIRDIAETKGISVNKIEKDLGFARSYLSKLRKSRPSGEVLKKIATYLDVSVELLLKDDADNKEEKKTFELDYESMLKIYTRGRNNLSSEEKIRLAQIILSDRNN